MNIALRAQSARAANAQSFAMSESSASVSVVPETEIPTWIDACGDEGVTSARKRKLGSGRDEAFSVELAFGALKEKFDACNLACAERAEEKKRLVRAQTYVAVVSGPPNRAIPPNTRRRPRSSRSMQTCCLSGGAR